MITTSQVAAGDFAELEKNASSLQDPYDKTFVWLGGAEGLIQRVEWSPETTEPLK